MERLTLEEAIAHAKEVAEKNYRGADFESIDSIDDDIKTNCIKCVEEHMQPECCLLRMKWQIMYTVPGIPVCIALLRFLQEKNLWPAVWKWKRNL